MNPEPAPAAGPVRKPPWLKWLAIAAASLFGFIALGIIIYVATDKGRIKLVVDGPQPIVKIDSDTVRIEGRDETITLRAGPHELVVQWGDGESKTQTFVVRRGDNTEWRVEYEPKPGPDKPPVPNTADSTVVDPRSNLFQPVSLAGTEWTGHTKQYLNGKEHATGEVRMLIDRSDEKGFDRTILGSRRGPTATSRKGVVRVSGHN